MQKIVLFGLISIMAATSANAGLFDSLFGKKSEPATLEEACSQDEITKICPEIALGTKTLVECLSENVSGLSDKCSAFVKKQAVAKVETTVETVKTKAEEVKAQAKAKSAEVKEKAKASAVEAKAKADESKATAKEIANSVKGIL